MFRLLKSFLARQKLPSWVPNWCDPGVRRTPELGVLDTVVREKDLLL